MKNGWLVALAASLALTLAPDFSEAKRMGGGKSSGMQRNMPARTAPQQTPPQPAQPGQAAPTQAAGTAATAGAAGAAAAAGKRSWLGPIAGIAAGLGIAALLSHFGLGAGFANFLTLLLLGVAAFFLIRFLLRRFGPRPPMPAAAGAGANTTLRTGTADWQAAQRPAQPVPATPLRTPEPVVNAYAPQPAAPAGVAPAFVPAAFDSEGFARIAKTIFVRLQAAHDNRDLDDLRRFTTPEMFAELKTDLLERGDAKDTTDVVRVDADVLDVAEDNGQRVVSVRFRGQVREEAGAEPVDFDEVWHLVQPLADDSRGWQIAGIEQMAH